jgi:hypothetical protein
MLRMAGKMSRRCVGHNDSWFVVKEDMICSGVHGELETGTIKKNMDIVIQWTQYTL